MENTENTENTEKCANTTEKNVFAETMKDGMNKVFGSVKTAIVMLLCIFSLLFAVGCKSLPTPAQMQDTATCIGCSAGMVVNMTKIDDKSKAVVLDVMEIVKSVTPKTNETFEVAWMPLATEYIKSILEKGEIDAAQADMILTASKLACKGLDYLFEVRCKEAKDYKELVEAAVHGFIDGFTTVVKPSNGKLSAGKPKYDEAAFEYLKAIK